MNTSQKIKIATRGSLLALAQAHLVTESIMLPAVAQRAIAITCHSGRADICDRLTPLYDITTCRPELIEDSLSDPASDPQTLRHHLADHLLGAPRHNPG